MQRPNRDRAMSRPIPDPHYCLALALVRQTVLDALNGGGPDELVWLFSPLAQLTLGQAMGLDEEGALATTRRAVRWMSDVAGRERVQLRALISQRAYLLIPEWKIKSGIR